MHIDSGYRRCAVLRESEIQTHQKLKKRSNVKSENLVHTQLAQYEEARYEYIWLYDTDSRIS